MLAFPPIIKKKIVISPSLFPADSSYRAHRRNSGTMFMWYSNTLRGVYLWVRLAGFRMTEEKHLWGCL